MWETKQELKEIVEFVVCAFLLRKHPLLVASVVLVLLDVEVLQLVSSLVGGHHAQEIPHLHLLQELLGKVLEIPLRECALRLYPPNETPNKQPDV